MALIMARLFASVLIGALLVIVPLAHGSPPDPTWIAGLYDDADLDDVVLGIAVLAALAAVTTAGGLNPLRLIGLATVGRDIGASLACARTNPARSPPVL